MNSNALILFGALLGLLIGALLGMKALRSRATGRKKVYMWTTLLLLIGSLLGGLNVAWRMSRPITYVPEPTPLPAQSQLLAHEWKKQDSFAPYHSSLSGDYRSSFSGRDGTLQWSYQRRPKGQGDVTFAEEAGVIYERTALPEKHEIAIVAARFSDDRELWSTSMKSAQPIDNLTSVTLPSDRLLLSDGKLYFQVDEVMYVLDTQDGKILKTIKPDLSDPDSLVSNFAVNNEALVITYSSARENESLADTFVCIRLSDGSMLWKSQRGQYQDLFALQGDTLYTQREGIAALRVHDGSEVWHARLPLSGIVASSASSEHVYLRAQNSGGSADATVYTLNARTGQVLWKVSVDTWSGGAPVEANGITYLADTNTFSAYQASTGQLLWQHKEEPFPSTAIAFNPYDVIYFSQPVILDGVVFVASNFVSRYPPPLRVLPTFCLGQCPPLTGISALRAADGKLYWHQSTGSWIDLVAV